MSSESSRSRELSERAIERLLDIGMDEASEPLASPTLGVDLGKYEILREIGRGGMGIVFEAQDTQLSRRVALKVLPQAAGHSEVFRKRFVREAKSVARLVHPNIAAVYEATPEFIAMQYVRGRALLACTRDDPRLAARLVRDAARAIRYAHEEGVIHRDLKPSNMLVEEGQGGEPKVYVMDFGLAKETAADSSLSGTGNILGTPAFMPPEQAEGRTLDVDERSDVYGLGATLYACVTGTAPFTGNDVLELLRKVSETEARPTRIDAELDAILLKCLAKERERRYQSAGELADDLERWLRGEPVRAQRPSWTYKARKFVARHRRLVVAGTLAALLAAGLGVFSWIQVQRNRDVRAAASDAAAFADAIRVVLADADAYRRKDEAENVRSALVGGLAVVERFRERHEEVGIAHFYHGLLLRGLGRNEEALAAFDRALALETSLVGARVHRGFVRLAHSERLEREFQKTKSAGASMVAAGAAERATRARVDSLRELAVADLESLSEEQSEATAQLTRVDTILRSAELSRVRRSFGVARDLLQLVLESDPTNVDAHRALAQIAREESDHAAERAHIQRANALARGLGYGYAFAQIDTNAERGELDASPASNAWQSARDFSGWRRWNPAAPGADEVVVLPGRDLPISDFAPGLARAASAAGRLALLAQSSMLEATRADEAARLGAWQASIEDLATALASDPELVSARSNRGVCWLQIARELFARGRANEALGAVSSARRDFDAALDRDPHFAPAYVGRALLALDKAARLEGFGRFRQAELAVSQALRDLDEATSVVGDATWAQVPSARARAMRARLRGPLGDTRGASEDRLRAKVLLEAVLTRAPERVLARYELGLLLRDLGEREAAARELRRALEAAPSDWPQRARCAEALRRLSG